MKLIILHLSDMHFSKKNSYQPVNIDAIVAALQQSVFEVQHIIILVSGDLAYSGKKSECFQVLHFFNFIKAAIKSRYGILDIKICVVPGNHDIDYLKGDRGASGLANIEDHRSYDKHISEELEKQEQFYILARRYNCFKQSGLVDKRIFIYGEKKIQVNLINTAIFSSLDNDQGFHYIPMSDIVTLKDQNDSDFIFSVMHHPHHWYSASCKKQLEEALYSRSDMVFVGHEHYESTQKVEGEDSSVKIFAAGKLCDQGNWADSEFHIGLLDLETREYISKKYHLNTKRMIYECIGTDKPVSLSRNRYNSLGLTLSSEYTQKLFEDKYLLSQDVLEYFVFPLLVEERITEGNGKLPEEISDFDSLWTRIQSKQKTIISGYNGAGKSVLARAIFREVSQSKITIFIEGKQYSGTNEGMIRDAFERMYSKNPTDYQAFLQKKPEDLIIIIDDIDAISERKQEAFIEFLSNRFGKIIMTCQSEIDVDIKSRLKKRATLEECAFFHIDRFYSNKRKELVSNIVYCVGDGDDEAREKTIDLLCDVLTRLNYLYTWNPEFLVQFVRYYCKNVGEATQNDGNVFSKVFEGNISALLNPYAKKDLSVDKIMVILDKIAYYIITNKRYPILSGEIETVIQDYNKRYGSKINTHSFINLLLEAKVIKNYDNGFVFYERNYLAYFAAREIKRECTEGKTEQFQHVLECSYMPINADILMFITYIIDSPQFIRSIMRKAEEVVGDWKEFDFVDTDIKFLVGGPDKAIGPVSEDEIKKEENKTIEQEKEEARELMVRNDATIFDGETADLDNLQRIMRAISLMIILARTLPSFEQIMEVGEKEQCVNLIYQMPLKIFRTLAEEMDPESGDLIQQIKDYHDWVYRKDKLKLKPLSDEQALSVLRWEALSMLLELMNSSFANATRANTIDFIDAFPYNTETAYGVEHIISLDRRDDLTRFYKEAIKLFEDTDLPMVKSSVQRVAKHFLIKSKKVKASDRDRFNAKIFAQGLNKGKLLEETTRSRGKK